MAQNQAAWVSEKGAPLAVGPADLPKAGPNEIVIKNHAVAVNPIDVAQTKFGFMVQSFPTVRGHDVAGEVYEVGSDVTAYRKGDRVFGHSWAMRTGSAEDAGFALYTKIDSRNTAAVPSNISYADAAVLPLGLDTAIAALYQTEYLDIPKPTTNPSPTGQVVIIYGGSSSIGLSAAQLAVASGVRPISIASPHNAELCKTSGASEVFDYKSADLVSDIIAAVGKDELAGIFLAICNDASWEHAFKILEHFGGGRIAASQSPPESLPTNVQAKQVFGLGEFSFPIWAKFIGQGLASGQIKCLPPPLVVGKGLESVQAGIDKLAAGVSAQKVVVEL